MKKKKVLSIIIIAAIVAGGTVGVSTAAVRTVKGSNRVVVVPVSEACYEEDFYDYDQMIEGYVVSGACQDIFLSESETIDKVYVKVGDQVKKGDILLKYDAEKTAMQLESAKLQKQKIELNIETVKKNISTLASLRPVAESSLEDDFSDDVGFDDEENEEPVDETTDEIQYKGSQKANKKLNSKSKYFYIDDDELTPGSEQNPYRYLAVSGAPVDQSFFEAAKKLSGDKKGSVFVCIEVRKGDKADGKLIGAWMQDVSKISVEDGFKGTINVKNPAFIIQDESEEKEEAASEPKQEDSQKQQKEPATEPDSTPSSESETEQDTQSGVKNMKYEIRVMNLSGPETMTAFGLENLTLTPLAMEDDIDDAEDEEDAGGDLGDFDGGPDVSIESLIPKDAEYTSEELAEAKKEMADSLEDLELNLKEADINIKKAEKAVKDGEVKATMDGVVQTVGNPQNPPTDGSPFLRVSGAGGISVRGGIAENKIDKIKEGDHITVMSWESETSYDAEITAISPYPDASGMLGMQTAGMSTYPFTAVIKDVNASLTDYEYVDITLASYQDETGSDMQSEDEMYTEGGTIYLTDAFIRDDDEGFYVFIQGENGRLVKQRVEIGEISGDSYEITEGLTWDDWIAFPYGKKVKEGAKTTEGTIEDIYGEGEDMYYD